MSQLVDRKILSWIATGSVMLMLVISISMLFGEYRKGNERLIAEIEKTLGASSLGQYLESSHFQRDPTYQPLLNRSPLIEYVTSNPPTLTPEQEQDGVPFHVFVDRYQAILDLTRQPEAREARKVHDFRGGSDHLALLVQEFAGMNLMFSIAPNNDLALPERLEWAVRSLGCIEGYMGGGFLMDESSRIALLYDWLRKCRFLLLELKDPDQLRQLLAALDFVEPPVEAFQSAMRMTYVFSLEQLRATYFGPQGTATEFYRYPGLNFVLSQLNTRLQNLDQPVEPLDAPWFSVMPLGPVGKFFPTQDEDFINVTLQLSHELAAGMTFFQEAMQYQIARLEGGDQALSSDRLTVKLVPSVGQIEVSCDRKQASGPTLPWLFDPYLFPE